MKNLNEIKSILHKSPGFAFLNIELTNTGLLCHSENENLVKTLFN